MGGHFDIESKQKEITQIEQTMNTPDFWNNIEKSNELNQKLSILKKETENYYDLESKITEDFEMCNILQETPEKDLILELENELPNLISTLEKLEINTLLSEKYDSSNCYLEIHPGAGGTESCDWASMLLRMYQTFCDKNNLKWELIEYQDGEEAGLKSATLHIIGSFPYGYLKCERGVHRLVRISPFDSNKRRHTSFASISVVPEIDQNINIQIKDEDIRIDTYCASGHGGQGVNTTPSAVRITHFPSKIVVTCQQERSQIQNKEQAMKVLKSKLYAIEEAKKTREVNDLKCITTGIDFGSQIRSYILEPYKLVKDNRSNYESSDPDKVLDGDIMPFIESVLKLK